jgi:hypothetical protein
MLDEFEALLREYRDTYLAEYGSFVAFEHGRTGHCIRVSAEAWNCHHMHVHLLPLAPGLAASIRLGQQKRCESLAKLAALAVDLDGYVMVYESSSAFSLFPVVSPLPPHFLRSRVSEVAGCPERADWEQISGDPASPVMIKAGRDRLARAMNGKKNRVTEPGLPVWNTPRCGT